MNPLLTEWLAGASEETRELFRYDGDANALEALHIVTFATGRFPNSDAIPRDLDRLRSLILRRLDGAERAREVAAFVLASDKPNASEFQKGGVQAAREFMEALDG